MEELRKIFPDDICKHVLFDYLAPSKFKVWQNKAQVLRELKGKMYVTLDYQFYKDEGIKGRDYKWILSHYHNRITEKNILTFAESIDQICVRAYILNYV